MASVAGPVVGRVLLGGEQDEGVGPHHLLEREDRLLASDEEGRDHVRKYDEVAKWQHRISSGFTWRKRWEWLCSGHGPKSVLLSLSAAIRLRAATTECRWAGKGIRAIAAISAPAAKSAPKGKYDTQGPFSRSRPPKKM